MSHAKSISSSVVEFPCDGVGDVPCDLIRFIGAGSLDHHPLDGLGARGPYNDSPVLAELLLILVNRFPYEHTRFQPAARTRPHVDEHLRELVHDLRKLREGPAGVLDHTRHEERGERSIPGRRVLPEYYMARLLTTHQGTG